MTDIHQWRRKIPQSRARTPASATELDGLDILLSPSTTPRKFLKPKLSSYFAQNLNASSKDVDVGLASTTNWPSGSTDSPSPCPDADNLIDTVMCHVLAHPYSGLDQRFNGMILRILEAFRNGQDERDQLRNQLSDQNNELERMQNIMTHSAETWEREKQDYKAEVKRLELIIADGKQGLAGVTMARRHSIIRRREEDMTSDGSDGDIMETIFEFLEKTKRFEDRAWSGQRANMRRRPSSPSANMKRLSGIITTGDLNESDLRFPMSPTRPPRANKAFASLDRKIHEKTNTREDGEWHGIGIAKGRPSDQAFSASSLPSDGTPEGATDVDLIKVAGTDNDFVAIKRIAQVVAKRRQIDPNVLMPKLLELFTAKLIERERSVSLPTTQQAATGLENDKSLAKMPLRKNQSLRTKASGLLQKLRPQLTTESLTGTPRRRFSFEQGDDATASAPNIERTAPATNRPLRRSLSLISMSDLAYKPAMLQEPLLSPVTQSPTSAPTSEPRRASRIPTPVYSFSSIARPRQEREDSASSLLTAIRISDDGTRFQSECLSQMGSTAGSPPPSNRSSVVTASRNTRCAQRSATYDRLVEHTNTLRGSGTVAVLTPELPCVLPDAELDSSSGEIAMTEPRPPHQSGCNDQNGGKTALRL